MSLVRAFALILRGCFRSRASLALENLALSLLNTPSVPDSEDRNRVAGSFPRGFMPPSRMRASSWSARELWKARESPGRRWLRPEESQFRQRERTGDAARRPEGWRRSSRSAAVPTENLIGRARLVFPGPAQHTPATRFLPDLRGPGGVRPSAQPSRSCLMTFRVLTDGGRRDSSGVLPRHSGHF